MKINFKKVSAVLTSALLVGLTCGAAVQAANYPQPFVAGSGDVAIVYGSEAALTDIVQAGNIQANLQSYMTGGDGSSTTVTGGDYWEIGTSSDNLELGESIKDIETYIGKGELSLLGDEAISNEKGEATYKQYLYFEDVQSSAVNYTKDDDDNVGLFFQVESGEVIARYVLDFTSNLKSDIESDGELSDIEDKSITFLGKTYTLVDATNGTSGAEFTLMSGALGGTATEGESITLNGYTVDVTVSSASAAQFTVTSASGTETTDKMNKGDMEKLSDGNYLAVTDITYEGYADGDQSATFYIGADKIEWKNGSSMTVNGNSISEANVIISTTESGGDITVSEIAINMTAEDDLYVPVDGKLSEASDLSEPEVLVSQNWDIEFKGLEATNYEDLSLKTSSDNEYILKAENYNGDIIELPLIYSNATGIYAGEKLDNHFILNPNGSRMAGTEQNITKGDYFLLHTADPVAAGNDAKTILVKYKSADKYSADDSDGEYVSLVINPGTEDAVTEECEIQSDGSFILKGVAGGTWNFANDSSAQSGNDWGFRLVGDDYADGDATANTSMSVYIRTKYNTLINITDANASNDVSCGTGSSLNGPCAGVWKINATIDDTNRDGDDLTVPAESQIFFATLNYSSASDASLTYSGGSGAEWVTDPDDSTIETYIGRYGFELTSTDPADSPASIEVKIPEGIVKPLVYISTGDLTVSSSTTSAGTQLGDVLVKDSEVSSVSSKNLIVVGGSCVNTVAASLLGSGCGSDFTDKTNVGSGQFLIQSLASTYDSSKIALIVAGFEADNTADATTYLKTQTVDTTAGKKYIGTSATSAELVTEETTA